MEAPAVTPNALLAAPTATLSMVNKSVIAPVTSLTTLALLAAGQIVRPGNLALIPRVLHWRLQWATPPDRQAWVFGSVMTLVGEEERNTMTWAEAKPANHPPGYTCTGLMTTWTLGCSAYPGSSTIVPDVSLNADITHAEVVRMLLINGPAQVTSAYERQYLMHVSNESRDIHITIPKLEPVPRVDPMGAAAATTGDANRRVIPSGTATEAAITEAAGTMTTPNDAWIPLDMHFSQQDVAVPLCALQCVRARQPGMMGGTADETSAAGDANSTTDTCAYLVSLDTRMVNRRPDERWHMRLPPVTTRIDLFKRERAYLRNGLPHGDRTKWRHGIQLESIQGFRNGLPHGRRIDWNHTLPWRVQMYDNGMLHGMSIGYDYNGRHPRHVSEYRHGLLHGTSVESQPVGWRETTQENRISTYCNGMLVSSVTRTTPVGISLASIAAGILPTCGARGYSDFTETCESLAQVKPPSSGDLRGRSPGTLRSAQFFGEDPDTYAAADDAPDPTAPADDTNDAWAWLARSNLAVTTEDMDARMLAEWMAPDD